MSQRVGPYRLGKTLGLGAFSKVKLAIHDITGEKVAIKILNRKKLKKMDMGAKVRREIDILKMFSHPHIIRLYEVIDTQSDIFCVMEYIEGGEMFDYIVQKGRLNEDEARTLFQQIVSGVEYCHFHMVVHRDLKPENILLDNESSVKLADFGLSNVMKDGQFLKTSCGSPNYAAPEVISGSLYAGPEVDVWSCGVILYAILCGSLPFDDENIRNLFKKIKEGHLNIPSYLSPQARDLIRQMLIVDPMKRMKLSEIRAHPWFVKNLPAYLAISAEQRINRAHVIDYDVVDAVARLGFDRNAVVEAVARGPDLLTSRKMAGRIEQRQMAVSYNLLLDRKRKEEQRNGIKFVAEPELYQLASAASAVPEAKLLAPEVAGALQNRRTTLAAVNAPALAPLTNEQSLTPIPSSDKGSKAKRKWYLGIWSKMEPTLIMKELCRTLQVVGFEWKVITPFKLKARCTLNTPTPILHSHSSHQPDLSEPQVVKIGIQLYRGSPTLFVIDIQKLSGHLFPFMDLCASLFREFRTSGDAIIQPITHGTAPNTFAPVTSQQSAYASPNLYGNSSQQNTPNIAPFALRSPPFSALPAPSELTGEFSRQSSSGSDHANHTNPSSYSSSSSSHPSSAYGIAPLNLSGPAYPSSNTSAPNTYSPANSNDYMYGGRNVRSGAGAFYHNDVQSGFAGVPRAGR